MKKINVIRAIKMLKKQFPVQQKNDVIGNIKKNWYFLISGMAFFCLTMDDSVGYFLGLLIVFGIMIFIASQIPSVWNTVKEHTVGSKLFCIASALGICLGNQRCFYGRTLKLVLKIGLPEESKFFFLCVSYFGAVCAVFFVFFCLLIFWKEIKQIIDGLHLFDAVNRKEWIVYGFMFMATIVFMIVIFARTEAFYGTKYLYDIIYTSDSPCLVKGNVYLALTHSENDLRQPLFAVFAAPFMGIPYLIGGLIGVSESVRAIFINSVQILMMFMANFMLAKMLKLDARKRICFMLLTSCTYTQILFALMMEQYIVAYFWLIFCIYIIAETGSANRIALWGAGGTLLTSMIFLPFMSNKSPLKNFKEWFMDMMKYGVEFCVFILVFCRFDVIFNSVSTISNLSKYTGKTVTFIDKIYQYTEYICNCFVAPSAHVVIASDGHVSWRLNFVTDINFVGVAILLLVMTSAIWNRNKKSSLLAAGWVVFSLVMLLVVGWGTKENGLILYALYFGWAFLALLFQLVERIEKEWNVRFLIPTITICVTIVLLVVNIPAIVEIVNFAITYYPV